MNGTRIRFPNESVAEGDEASPREEYNMSINMYAGEIGLKLLSRVVKYSTE